MQDSFSGGWRDFIRHEADISCVAGYETDRSTVVARVVSNCVSDVGGVYVASREAYPRFVDASWHEEPSIVPMYHDIVVPLQGFHASEVAHGVLVIP
ncbi:hypothetical protein ACFWY6_40835, partial [Streptomyces sp. NPDC059037]|uniref:hypothetical protein n=1 Tax=Streptomyces sp. NPDC059037 TaxID=3346710 RepID=UPI0036CB0530